MRVEVVSGVTSNDLYEHLKSTYEGEEFVKLLHGSSAPRTSHVAGSNYCVMTVYEYRIPRRAIIISVVSVLSYHAESFRCVTMSINNVASVHHQPSDC